MSKSPLATALQASAASKSFPKVPKRCLVTGGTGFVGQRLVEMLVERGAEKVISFDVVGKPANAWSDPRIEWVQGDITDRAALFNAVEGADCVWHNAAAVGPFHPLEVYERVNYQGTLNVIEACRHHRVPKIVMSSSPSTRFTGEDVDGLTEAQLPSLPMKSYLQGYAESKARGELALSQACCDELMTIAVAPHQVYGPRDNLFMPNLLEAAGTGRLRIFGRGENRICFTHVDNYCHALIIAERSLYPASPTLGKFYIVTDAATHPFSEGYALFWDTIDTAITGMGFTSLKKKMKLNFYLLMFIAGICDLVGRLIGTKFKLSVFNVRMLTMHRWFNVDAAAKDLKYEPIISFREGWPDAIEWFKANWLPDFNKKSSSHVVGIAKQSQDKIDIQTYSVMKEQAS